jgi:hypothetical protein
MSDELVSLYPSILQRVTYLFSNLFSAFTPRVSKSLRFALSMPFNGRLLFLLRQWSLKVPHHRVTLA